MNQHHLHHDSTTRSCIEHNSNFLYRPHLKFARKCSLRIIGSALCGGQRPCLPTSRLTPPVCLHTTVFECESVDNQEHSFAVPGASIVPGHHKGTLHPQVYRGHLNSEHQKDPQHLPTRDDHPCLIQARWCLILSGPAPKGFAARVPLCLSTGGSTLSPESLCPRLGQSTQNRSCECRELASCPVAVD